MQYNEAGRYSYLADGTKAKASRSGADSLLYRGGMVLRKSGSTVTFERASVPGGRIVAATEAGGTGTGNKMLYYITDHLGSTRFILDGSNGNIMERMTYTPMGRKWTATGSGSGSPSAGSILATNRYRYNGKEEQALPAGLPYTDYGARFFDSDAYTWLTPDPLSSKYPSIAPHNFCAGDPVNYVDPQGDSIIVSYTGYILYENGDDNGVYYSNDGELTYIGELDGIIDISFIFTNLLDENTRKARFMDPFRLKSLVTDYSEWDYKDNKNTIYGRGNRIAHFMFNGMNMEAQDVGNYHFGAVCKANVFITGQFALIMAGRNQMQKGLSLEVWQPKIRNIETFYSPSGVPYSIVTEKMGPPYGDDPRDQEWIKHGFRYKKYK